MTVLPEAVQVGVGAAGGWGLLALIILALVKGWPALRKLQIEQDGSLRTDLLTRIKALEEALAKERRDCSELIADLRRELRQEYEGRLAAQGRQIDELQRELFEIRRIGMKAAEHARSGHLDELVRKLDEES